MKTKVILLGRDQKLLKNIAERVNKTRPAEILSFSSLKDFLETCIEESPDLVGVSVNFPHPSTPKFTKVFKMALNIPVLTFGEDLNVKTRKLLSASTGDVKIQGVITAHNLWMKIVSLKKSQEEDGLSGGDSDGSGNNRSSLGSSVFLKGESPSKMNGNKNNILSSMFAALEEGNESGSTSKLNMFTSTDSSDSQKNGLAYFNTDEPTTENKKPNMNHVGGKVERTKTKNEASPLLDDRQAGHDPSPEFGHQKTNHANSDRDKGSENPRSTSQNKTKGLQGFSEMAQKEAQGESPKFSPISPLPPKGSEEREGTDKSAESKKDPKMDTNEAGLNTEQNHENHKGSQSDSGLMSDPKGSSLEKPTPAQRDFGAVELADGDELKKEAKKKNLEKEKHNEEKNKNLLKISCESALEKQFDGKKIAEKPIFNTQNIEVFTIDVGVFKGYLLLTSNKPQIITTPEIEAFRIQLIDNLRDKGIVGEVSKNYSIHTPVDSYTFSVSEFSDFSINSQNDHAFFNVSFVKREVLTPTLKNSEKEDMFFVDVKVIPPQTPVNFDVYIHLPKNKRFVRYLKAGRSLSLKQAKRHSEEDLGSNHLYLPKNQIKKFETFFIENTLNWEFSLHKKKEVS